MRWLEDEACTVLFSARPFAQAKAAPLNVSHAKRPGQNEKNVEIVQGARCCLQDQLKQSDFETIAQMSVGEQGSRLEPRSRVGEC